MSDKLNEIKESLNTLNRANVERLDTLEKTVKDADVLLSEKNSKLEKTVIELQNQVDKFNAALTVSSNGYETRAEEILETDYKAVLNSKLLRGVAKYDLSDSERKVVDEYNNIHRAVAVGDANNNTGGYLVPTDNPTGIIAQVRAMTPWMELVETGETTARDPIRIVQTSNFSVTRAVETSAATNTSTGTHEEVRGLMGNYEAEPWVTEDMLADVSFDLVGFINGNISETISFALSEDFLNGAAIGAGVRGLLADAALSSVSTWDRIGEVAATQPVSAIATGGLGFGLDDVYTAMYAIDLRYRFNPAELTIGGSNKTIQTLLKMKDNDGQYLYKPSVNVGDPASFNGVRVVEFPNMTSFTAAGNPVALIGNFRQAYALLNQPAGTKTVVDVITNKAYTKYYYKQRNAGFYKDLRALRVLTAK